MVPVCRLGAPSAPPWAGFVALGQQSLTLLPWCFEKEREAPMLVGPASAVFDTWTACIGRGAPVEPTLSLRLWSSTSPMPGRSCEWTGPGHFLSPPSPPYASAASIAMGTASLSVPAASITVRCPQKR